MAATGGTFDRAAALERLGSEQFDVLVVGGGITGCGVALDAAARGLRVALAEKDDFASGTSSRSSKLVHGGLRYLQQREFLLVYENLLERQRLLRNAPHLVSVLPFLVPVFGRGGVANKAFAKAMRSALWMYDLTGGARIGRLHRRIGAAEVVQHMPTLAADRLVDGFLYYDARADDARLTLALARTAAVDWGAVCVNHAPVTGLSKDASGAVVGARVQPAGSQAVDVRADCVVNATGVWADHVRAMDEGTDPRSIRPAKGIHLTVPAARLPCDIAAVLSVPGDRRSIFVVPWGPLTYVGTTDTDYDGPLDDPRCTPDDVAYLLRAVNAWVSEPLAEADVTASWAGLRPLLSGSGVAARTADLSRRHRVDVSPSGLVSITGGKLTTYRKMAADTVDVVVRRLGRGRRHSPTRRLPLVGSPGVLGSLPVPDEAAQHLVSRYGSEARRVLALVDGDPSLAEPLVPGLPYCRAEAVFAVEEEMARDLHDVLDRRTRARVQARDATAAAADEVAALLGPRLGWSAGDAASAAAAYRADLDAERAAAGLPAVPA